MMKGLIIKDFLNLKKNIKMMLITTFIYILFFITYDPTFLCGLLIMIFSLQSLSTFSYDEYSNWDVFALSLPISRKELTLSKYIVFSIFPIFGALLAGILTTGISLFKGIMPNDELLISAIACLFTAELLVFILLPFIFKYGIERGRIMMMVLSFSIFGVIVLFGKLLNGLSIPDLSIKLETIFPLLPWIGIIVLLMIAYLSYQLSYRIIMKKEY